MGHHRLLHVTGRKLVGGLFLCLSFVHINTTEDALSVMVALSLGLCWVHNNGLLSLFILGNYSVAGFELTLRRKVSHYIITYYLPSGMFVIVSWISFLVPPDIVPGRMTLLVTVFLVLVNIFNTITTNIPKAEGLTAIEAWVIVCVLFVFGALIEYAGLLLKMKLAATRPCKGTSRENSLLLNGKMPDEKKWLRGISRRKQREDISHARLDILFLLLFPLFFLIFNLIYWLGFLYGPCSHCTSDDDTKPIYNVEYW